MNPGTLHRSLLASFCLLAFTAGCRSVEITLPPPQTTLQAPTLAQTPTQPDPTPTLEPVAAIVNGEGISKTEYEAELARLQAAQAAQGIGMGLGVQQKIVLDELIGQTLLAQAARDAGYVLDDAGLDARISALAARMGGQAALDGWQAAHGYNQQLFKTSLQRAAAAEWMLAQIYAEVPAVAEQVHSRQILTFDEASAQTVLSRLESGIEFATLAYRYDAVTGGDLGWFPRGFLTAPEVEEAAFSIEPGQYSPIVKSSLGYHIVLVIEKDPQRPLSPDARLVLQEIAAEEWIAGKLAESQVVLSP